MRGGPEKQKWVEWIDLEGGGEATLVEVVGVAVDLAGVEVHGGGGDIPLLTRAGLHRGRAAVAPPQPVFLVVVALGQMDVVIELM